MLNAISDVTPLPSPLLTGDSPGPWKKMARPTSRGEIIIPSADSVLVTASGESIYSAIASQTKRRAFHELAMGGGETALSSSVINKEKTTEGSRRNRSISEYVPDPVQGRQTRQVTVSGSHISVDSEQDASSTEIQMRREPHLAVQRGLAPTNRPPTPPSSRTGGESSDSDSSLSKGSMGSQWEYFDARTRDDAKKRRWRSLKTLGQGTFSRVMLATSEPADEVEILGNPMAGTLSPALETVSDSKRRKVVAIKVCEHGPAGGASEERVEMSLKRELEIMKSIHHPSLVHLLAWSIEETRALLVLSYCPGGDLFDVASTHRDLLVPGLLGRIFAELVGAVGYLHKRHIVHRDIKLESKHRTIDLMITSWLIA
jgi:protein-serine/threonine kinase